MSKPAYQEIMEMPGQVTQWLRRLRSGDGAALEQIMPLLYDELRLLARKQLRGERRGHTLATVDLINEAYLRLVDQRQLQAGDRAQFFAIAATAMACPAAPITHTHVRRGWRSTHGVSAACGNIEPDSRTGTSNPTAHAGAPSATSSQVSTVDALTT